MNLSIYMPYSWAWCLPTGFSTPITYFYVVYFAILLVHRQMRDDHACTEKYGDDWKEVCLVPGVETHPCYHDILAL